MRESGILMHITSLPGPYGIGTMGRQAYRFVDFLEEAGIPYEKMLGVGICLPGMINGSAVANVATTGTITIPLMKRTGYKKEFAGAGK